MEKMRSTHREKQAVWLSVGTRQDLPPDSAEEYAIPDEPVVHAQRPLSFRPESR